MSTSTTTRTARAQRRAARRRAHHLVAADERSLLELELFLATLPLCATGRVFIEVPDASQVGFVSAPPRMTVTWLTRASRTGAPGTGRLCASGEALARAVSAWADEMLCAENCDTSVTLLGGYLGTADIVDHLIADLRVPTANISAPERFGLLPTER